MDLIIWLRVYVIWIVFDEGSYAGGEIVFDGFGTFFDMFTINNVDSTITGWVGDFVGASADVDFFQTADDRSIIINCL